MVLTTEGAIFIPDTYTIVFNTDWLDSMHDQEILRCAFHETRHAYQRACLEFPKLMVVDVSNETLKNGKKNSIITPMMNTTDMTFKR